MRIDQMDLENAKNNYYVVINGKTVPLKELTQDQLIVQLAGMMEHMEYIDSQTSVIAHQIQAWRNGNLTAEQLKQAQDCQDC